ncbi:hypothetical protein CB0940_01009 [Cercospora beticola]|uniref:Uncharacterized protein n=1 Tax=Cercospora beticola TaxID=122368 RepID=A0A2G5I7S9_CERBT|nr:hypothetical protein CB0940_01009 [Cercospora beticola]PIB00906.1 hypothetical protein CB0940_01009 [Cercospora beticola]WPA96433.1 hypothetical protein RHO25_001040 [Cercospora beticola]
MAVTPNMSCPSGGQFYACGDGSRFVGCCASNPCAVGCAAGNLVTTSFDTAQYGAIPDQQCSTGQFFTCNFTSPPFWGCCTSPACSSTNGCASTALAGAFLTTNPTLSEPFLSLNETWEASSTENTDLAPTSDNDDSGGGGGTNTGAIAGGVVGGIVALAAILFGLIWMLRRRKRRAAAAAVSSAPAEDESKPGVPELSHDASTAVALKQLPGNWQTSPSIPSYHNSPEFQNGEWSPRPPSYFTNDPRAKPQHMSYELPGSQAGVEMDVRREQDGKPPPSPAA